MIEFIGSFVKFKIVGLGCSLGWYFFLLKYVSVGSIMVKINEWYLVGMSCVLIFFCNKIGIIFNKKVLIRGYLMLVYFSVFLGMIFIFFFLYFVYKVCFGFF